MFKKYRVVLHSIDMFGTKTYRLEKRVCLCFYTKWIQTDTETKVIFLSTGKDSLTQYAERLSCK